ncbi:uncharacterized protein EV422DRAFT_622833 [Fimicolochytrium jonesii]|uniref:uncharacterized protein n=1 Tax=Fimicolochytrium jonesii TaxID=1396493 RepID=UPI0022FDBE15|nr:uncharacterized protein EV422DRAFT_622833 [Fimicolochytrium jonesii]KAI8817150.1 hypothetical protein EV422DRAFT_622833 [Fimicolochytrium jonesii]
MSSFLVSLHCATNGNTASLKNGSNIIGRGEILGLSDRRLSKKQLNIVVDAQARTVTAERLGPNPSSHNGRDMPKDTIILLRHNDKIALVAGTHICTLSIVQAAFSSVPYSDPVVGITSSEADLHPSQHDDGVLEEVAMDTADHGAGEEEEDVQSHAGVSDTGEAGFPVRPEDFSEESDDVVGSGLDVSEAEEAEAEAEMMRMRAVAKRPAAERRPPRVPAGPGGRKRAASPSARARPRTRAAATATGTGGARRVTSYGAFVKATRPALKREYPHHSGPEITKLLKRRWMALDDEARKTFEDQAAAQNEASAAAADTEAAASSPSTSPTRPLPPPSSTRPIPSSSTAPPPPRPKRTSLLRSSSATDSDAIPSARVNIPGTAIPRTATQPMRIPSMLLANSSSEDEDTDEDAQTGRRVVDRMDVRGTTVNEQGKGKEKEKVKEEKVDVDAMDLDAFLDMLTG